MKNDGGVHERWNGRRTWVALSLVEIQMGIFMYVCMCLVYGDGDVGWGEDDKIGEAIVLSMCSEDAGETLSL